MRVETVTTVVAAPRDRVFDFFSKIENLPRWAIEFCQKLEVRDGRHIVSSPMGEVPFTLDPDPGTGVVDMTGGPDEAHQSTWPARVVALPDGTSAVLFTVVQEPQLSDEAFEGQLASLRREMAHLRTLLE